MYCDSLSMKVFFYGKGVVCFVFYSSIVSYNYIFDICNDIDIGNDFGIRYIVFVDFLCS